MKTSFRSLFVRPCFVRSAPAALFIMGLLPACAGQQEPPVPHGNNEVFNSGSSPRSAVVEPHTAQAEVRGDEKGDNQAQTSAKHDYSLQAAAPPPAGPVRMVEQSQSQKRKVAAESAAADAHHANTSATPRAATPAPKDVVALARPFATAPLVARSTQPAVNAVSQEPNTERYTHIAENGFMTVASKPLSTFSIDVDTASYANVRRLLQTGQAVDPGAVRIEEMVNYFSYDYPQPSADRPFSVTTEVSQAPWAPEHSLVLIGLQGKSVNPESLPPRNLVFLIDVSGSMESPNKLPLLKASFTKLLDTMGPADRVALVVYAGASGLVLPSTPANQRATILEALERLEAGGSTNGAAGIELAYQVAAQQANAEGINRVILATDGDFNVGTTSNSALVDLIEAKRKTGVYLTVLGFGMGNYNDSTLESLADHGNGNYAYIDSLAEAQKVLVTEASGTLLTIAKDVKIQVEFNPETVGAYRLIGYENRALLDHEFNDDTKDAGEIGAGHRVTALYEVVPPALVKQLVGVEALKYQKPRASTKSSELMTVKLRYKQPKSDTSQLLSVAVANERVALKQSSNNFRFASAVAAFGMHLRHSKHAAGTTPSAILELASGALGRDPHGHRAEFLSLVKTTEARNASMVAR